eukprot:5800295-Pleurochrysis_carterae.AAC.2
MVSAQARSPSPHSPSPIVPYLRTCCNLCIRRATCSSLLIPYPSTPDITDATSKHPVLIKCEARSSSDLCRAGPAF